MKKSGTRSCSKGNPNARSPQSGDSTQRHWLRNGIVLPLIGALIFAFLGWFFPYPVSYYPSKDSKPDKVRFNFLNKESRQIDKPNPIAGYTFHEWRDDSGAIFTKLPIFRFKELKLYAQWHPITYSIIFNASGGTGAARDTVYTIESGDFILPTELHKEGYSFIGWSSKTDSHIVEQIPSGSTGNKELELVILYI